MSFLKRLIKKISNKNVILYHGTSSVYMDEVLKNGIIPGTYTGKSVYKYINYNRKGKPKHPDSVYLTNSVDKCIEYANQAVKNLGGFPIVLKVSADESALTWDDDSFYMGYGEFDFGEKNVEEISWNREPKKELWEQSLDLQQQLSHHGIVKPNQISSIHINEKWISKSDFIEIFEKYKDINLKSEIINIDKELSLIDHLIQIEGFSFIATFVNRKIYMYNFQIEEETKYETTEKEANSIAIMQFLKESLLEFGAEIVYTKDIYRVAINPKKSLFFYAFGISTEKTEEKLFEDIELSIEYLRQNNDIFKKLIDGNATEKEFDFVYNYSIDFVGDFISFCKNKEELSEKEIINVMKKIKDKYKNAYVDLSAQIEYLEFNLNS